MAEVKPLIFKLSKIRSAADVVKKNKHGYGYTYTDITEILSVIKNKMEILKVSLIPSVVPGTMNVTQINTVTTKSDKAGNIYENKSSEMLVSADMVFTWINEEDTSDVVKVPWALVGSQTDPSQAFGSGLTYCTRYFLTDYFQIPQVDDVDDFRSRQKAAEDAENAAICDAIIKEIDTLIRTFLGENEGKSEEVKELTQRYVKGGNYNKIKDPRLAASLLKEFKKTFLGIEEEK